MPEMDGLELCESIRSDPEIKHSYIILLTSRNTEIDRIEALNRGADDFLTKPCNCVELLDRVRMGMRVRTMQREIAATQHTRALLKMAVTVSHEINTPLTGLIAFLEISREKIENQDFESLGEKMEKCLELSQRILEIVDCLQNLKTPVFKNYFGDIDMLDLAA